MASPEAHVEEATHVEQSFILEMVAVIVILSFMMMRVVEKLKLTWLSESASTILVGFVVGSIIHFGIRGVYQDAISFDEETFSFYILPPIIFEAGFSLQHAGVLQNMGTILTLAVPGTLLSALLIGLIAYYASESLFPEMHHRPIWEAMCLGAILSAIDPVAVISVLGKKFQDRKAPRLYYIIFGESVLNDAVAVVLYKVFLEFLKEGKDPTFSSVVMALLTFVYISVTSIAIGWFAGALSAFMFKNVEFRSHGSIEIVSVVIFGLGSYYLAEAAEMSGIMALFICGRVMGHYTWHNLSSYSQVVVPALLRAFALLAETYVFSFLGLSFWSFKHDWKIGFTVVVLLSLFLARLMVFPAIGFCNLLRKKHRVSFRAQIFLWVTGLRGAIAFGLALSSDNNKHIKSGRQFVSTTLLVVLFTVFFLGGLCEFLLRILGLDEDEEQDVGPAPQTQEPPSDPQAQPQPESASAPPSNSCFYRLFEVERKYIAPFLRVKHHSQPMVRYQELGVALQEVSDRFDVKSRVIANRQASEGERAVSSSSDAPQCSNAPQSPNGVPHRAESPQEQVPPRDRADEV